METNHPRLTQLLAFYQEDPTDAFTVYALATEYLKLDKAESRKYYEKLLAEHPNYAGTYYHAAKLYIELGLPDKADEIYQKGLKISRQEGNMHAFSELQQAYNKFKGLDYEDED
jgi:Tfp pilus assembly protein PilF